MVVEIPSANENEIQQLLGELTNAWDRRDASAFGARYRADGTLTNVNDGFYVGRDEFNLRHDEVFRGVFKGTTMRETTPGLVRHAGGSPSCARKLRR